MTLGTRPSRRPTRPTRATKIRVNVEPYDVSALIGLRRAPAPAKPHGPEGHEGDEHPSRESGEGE
jgi:hypothetical protein